MKKKSDIDRSRLIQTLLPVVLILISTACLAQSSAWNSYMDSGNAALKQGKYKEAQSAFASAVKEAEKFGSQDSRLGVSLSYLALIQKKQGDLAQAEMLYKRAVSIFEKGKGPNDPEVAANVEGLAEVLAAQGRHAEAEPLYRRALSICEKRLGPEHPHVSQSLNNLATLYRDQQRYKEAEPLYKRAQAIDRKTLSPNHPDLARTLGNLGELYRQQARYAEAEPLLKQALAIFEKAQPPNSGDVLTTLDSLGVLYLAQSKFSEAEAIMNQAIAIGEQRLGPNHPAVVSYRKNLVMLDTVRCTPLMGEQIETYKARSAGCVNLVDQADKDASYTFERLLDKTTQEQLPGYKQSYRVGTAGGRINRAVLAVLPGSSAAVTSPFFTEHIAAFVMINNPSLVENKENSHDAGKALGRLLREVHDTGNAKTFEYPGCAQEITATRDGDGRFLVTMVARPEKAATAARREDPDKVALAGDHQKAGATHSARTSPPDAQQDKRYLGDVMSRISRSFIPPEGVKSGSGSVLFNLHKGGNVSDIHPGKSTAGPAVDQALAEAVQKAAPFPPLPPDNPEHVQLRFVINMTGPFRSTDLQVVRQTESGSKSD